MSGYIPGGATYHILHIHGACRLARYEPPDSVASAKLTKPTGLTISNRPTTEVAVSCSERNTTELSRPITGTSNSAKEVVTAGKVRATVTKAHNGNAVISGPV